MNTFWIIAYSVLATLFIAAIAYAGVLIHTAITEDIPNKGALHKEEYVKKSDIIDMYENDFPDLDDGVHWSRSDIISNLDAVPSYFMLPVEEDKNE